MTAGADRVFGMGHDALVEPDWPPLTAAEASAAVGVETVAGHTDAAGRAVIEWRSPRPLSATARVRLPDGRAVIVKRLPAPCATPKP